MESSPKDLATITDRILECAEYLDGATSDAHSQLLTVSEELAILRGKITLSASDRVRKEQLEREEHRLHALHAGVTQELDAFMAQAENFENGCIAENDMDALIDIVLPNDDIDEGPVLSKRKRAIREANLAHAKRLGIDPDSWEFRWTFGKDGTRLSEEIGLTTDPRRLATGRAATRIVTDGTLDSLSAQDTFMAATTDTHGGKSRRPGKNAQYYVGRNGRSVRKR